MNKIHLLILLFLFTICKAQTLSNSSVKFTSDLREFKDLSALRESLKDVEIIALGEQSHGLGEIFNAKTELVKFLHKELGFDVVLFESGYGDGALAWERVDSLSPIEFTNSFSSNHYYNSEEILALVTYVKSQKQNLKMKGFDCQPLQNFLIKRMTEIAQPLDTVLAKSVKFEMRSFNNLYQFEKDHDTISFNKQLDRFFNFLDLYNSFLKQNLQELVNSGTTKNEIDAIRESNKIFKNTYSKIEIGDLWGWPVSLNNRDKSMFEIIKMYKEKNPKSKIIIWAQNSHIENKSKPNQTINWMGHSLKKTYGDRYYSIGAIVYSGKDLLGNNGPFEFESSNNTYLAYHLNQFKQEKFVLDLRAYDRPDFTNQLLLGMESYGNTSEFIAKERFDGLLFIKYSDIPKLIEKK
jgi:erythromycin esterase